MQVVQQHNSSLQSPSTQQISISHIQGINNQMFEKIFKGEVNISEKSSSLELKKISKKQQEASNVQLEVRQKLLLQRRLAYLNKSIETNKAASALGKLQNNVQKQDENPEVYQQRMRSIKRKQKEIKKSYQKQKQQLLANKLVKIEQQSKTYRQKRLEQQEERKRDLSQNIRKIKQRKVQRQTQDLLEKNKIKSLLKMQTIHNRLLRQQQAYDKQMLQQRQKKLNILKKQHKPIDPLEIQKHEKKFLQYKKQKQQDRLKERQEFMSRRYEAPYESIYYKKVKNQQQKETSSYQAASKRQKIKQFSQHVKQKYRPEMSHRLMKQSSMRSQKQLEKIQTLKFRQSSFQSRKKGLQYLTFIKSLPKSPPSTTVSSQPSIPMNKYHNYLVHKSHGDSFWQQYISKSKNIDSSNMAQFLQYSQTFQQKLKLKQQKSRLLSQEELSDIDQKYIEIINAKLEVYKNNKN